MNLQYEELKLYLTNGLLWPQVFDPSGQLFPVSHLEDNFCSLQNCQTFWKIALW